MIKAMSILAWVILIGLNAVAIISYIKEPPHRVIREALRNLDEEDE